MYFEHYYLLTAGIKIELKLRNSVVLDSDDLSDNKINKTWFFDWHINGTCKQKQKRRSSELRCNALNHRSAHLLMRIVLMRQFEKGSKTFDKTTMKDFDCLETRKKLCKHIWPEWKEQANQNKTIFPSKDYERRMATITICDFVVCQMTILGLKEQVHGKHLN